MKKFELKWVVLMVAALTLQVGCGAKEEKRDVISIATGGTGGTYYILGTVLQTELGKTMSVSVQSGNASVANCNRIAREGVETAFVQDNIADDAYHGRGAFEGHAVTNLRVIAALYPEAVQVVARKTANVQHLRDAKGKTIAVGDKDSGTEIDARNILLFHNLTYDDIAPLYLFFSLAAQKVEKDRADVMFVTAGYPTSSIIEVLKLKECNFVNLDPEAISKLCDKYPFYVPITIPANTYQEQTQPVNTVAVMALWVASSNLDDKIVYKVTKALWAKGGEGKSVADAVAAGIEQGQNMKLETALKGVTIPLHPGAEKFYKEVGMIK